MMKLKLKFKELKLIHKMENVSFEDWVMAYDNYLEQLYRIVSYYTTRHISRDAFNKIVFKNSSQYISEWL